MSIQQSTSSVSSSSRIFDKITLLKKKHYGYSSKLFCCKCFYCCQDFDFSLLTSQNRKTTFQRMVHDYLKMIKQTKDVNVIVDPFFILVALLLGQQSQTYSELFAEINTQNVSRAIFSKQDLQFYIPQLCTYLVFHEQMKNQQLCSLLQRACKIDIQFSLKYYFYMQSLQIIINDGTVQKQIKKIPLVEQYNHNFRQKISLIYKNNLENFYPNENKFNDDNNIDGHIQQNNIDETLIIAKNYNCRKFQQFKIYEKIHRIVIPSHYQIHFQEQKKQTSGIFQSTANFLFDLISLSKLLLIKQTNSRQELIKGLSCMNNNLPAMIFLPFKSCYQSYYALQSIVYEQCKVYNTKTRSPYYLCLQAFKLDQTQHTTQEETKIKSLNRKNKNDKLMRTKLFSQDENNQGIEDEHWSEKEANLSLSSHYKKGNSRDIRLSTQSNHSNGSNLNNSNDQHRKGVWQKLFQLKKQAKRRLSLLNHGEENNNQGNLNNTELNNMTVEQIKQSSRPQQMKKQRQQQIDETVFLFGETENEQFQRIKKISPFSNLPGYKLIHLIIKNNDDLKQQYFAMQLLEEIQIIFKMENLALKLVPYQVLPLTYNSGIIEYLKDTITIDQLYKRQGTFNFIKQNQQKLNNFIQSLASYSLVTYLLQVKDRHNANIMIHKNGCIIHIDFGFFLSNMPGKGVGFEGKLPFKMTKQYLQVMGGTQSKQFTEFRRLFYQGYNALRKHQHRILILIKLMYSSYGTTMPCFQLGDQCISLLQQRFNPIGVHTDAEMCLFCQNLINSSVDNWRSRWYDKWQYYMQGILY